MKSNCCNAPLITHQSDEGTGYYSCSECKKPCDPQPQQEGWEYKKGEMVKDLPEGGTQYRPPTREEIDKLLSKAKQEERDSWLNQKANDHDARIRADERTKLLREVKELVEGLKKPVVDKPVPSFFGLTEKKAHHLALYILTIGYNEFPDDLLSAIDELKG